MCSARRSFFRWFVQVPLLLLFTITLWPEAATAARIRLSWFDSATSEDGFTIERKTGTTGTFVQIATLEANTTAYTDVGLTAETTYCYQVRAFNTLMTSPHSAEACTTALASTVDTDGDGLTDEEEIELYGTDPTRVDTDNDGLSDGDEVNLHVTDPTAADTDGDGISDGVELSQDSNPLDPVSQPLPLETGEVKVDHKWAWVEFNEHFVDPIVVAKPLSSKGPDPAVVRIRNVGPSGFEIRIQEWAYLDGWHTAETVGYIVMERGNYILADGTLVEAGKFETNKASSFGTVIFNQPFNTVPVVIAVVSSFNEVDTVTGRLRNININGFDFRMQEQESNAQEHATETISYIAWEPSAGTLQGLAFEVATTPDAVTHQFYQFWFTELNPFAAGGPVVFLADMQTTDGGDAANVRWRNKDLSGAEVQISEGQSKDSETSHTTEAVGYIVFAPKN